MAIGAVCPACFDGVHGECIGNGCYCECQLEEFLRNDASEDFDRDSENDEPVIP